MGCLKLKRGSTFGPLLLSNLFLEGTSEGLCEHSLTYLCREYLLAGKKERLLAIREKENAAYLAKRAEAT